LEVGINMKVDKFLESLLVEQ